LFIQGRLDTLIISGGENIYPQEIEGYLQTYPQISEACVVGVPDETYGTRPVAFIRCPQHIVADTESIRDYLRKYLPSYKIPDYFLPWPDETYSLKPDRQKLRQLAMKILAK